MDGTGKVWVAGTTTSQDFPLVNGLSAAFQFFEPDLFVAQFKADGSGLLFSSYTTDIMAYPRWVRALRICFGSSR